MHHPRQNVIVVTMRHRWRWALVSICLTTTTLIVVVGIWTADRGRVVSYRNAGGSRSLLAWDGRIQVISTTVPYLKQGWVSYETRDASEQAFGVWQQLGFGRQTYTIGAGQFILDPATGQRFRSGAPVVVSVFEIPLWFPLLLSVFPLMLVAARWVGARRRHRMGRCPRCGYDLRATPQRCPECGFAPAPAATPASA